jgi:peptidyl-prolyl cis-trans isomerase SurA
MMLSRGVGSFLVPLLILASSGAARALPAQDSTSARVDSLALPLDPRIASPVSQAVPKDTTFVVDRVVAVVGNRPVLASQVDEEIFSRQSQGAQMPNDPEGLKAIRQQIVSSIIDEELLLQQAHRDTAITVTDEEIASGVEEQVRKVRSNFTSEVDYTTELKKAGFQTPEEYRRWLTDQQRRAAFQNRLIEKLRNDGKLKPVAPTEKEMKQFFEEQKDRTKAQADSIVLELRRGADFATAARRFSQDPGSKEQGGSLNWFRRGVMVPEFEKVAFSLKPGVVSDPVESPFGYHIIQVERVQPGEVQARHILLVPELDSARVAQSRLLADSLRNALAAGASFDSLQRLHHDRTAEREAENVPVTKLPENYAKAIGEAAPDSLLPVFVMPGAGSRDQFVVLQVTDRRPEGEIRYEDVRDRIRQQLGEQLAIRRYLDGLRKSTYVEIRS